MPSLVSPGVDVSVIDESFRSTGIEGTVPLIIVATDKNKSMPGQQVGDPTGYAPGTIAANAGSLYLITSQRELVQTFGDPVFQSTQGTPLHGNELNEYGMLAAYQFLGVANRAYVLRADVPLGELEATSTAPTDDPANGTYWFDLANTVWGVFKSNGGANPSEYDDWDVGTTNIIDVASTEAEYHTIGDLTGADAVSDADANLVTVGGTLSINTVDVTLALNDSLNDVVLAINTAAGLSSVIPDVVASVNYTEKGLNIKIANSGTISLTGTTASVQTDLGLDNIVAITSQVQHPQASVGSTGEYAVVTLDTQNRYYEKLVAKDADGVNVTGASADWYQVGTDAWRETQPTLIVGTTASPSFAGSEDINLTLDFDGSVTVGATYLTTIGDTVTDVRNALAADAALAPYITSGQLSITVDGSGYLRIVNLDGRAVTTTGSAAVLLGTTQLKGRTLTYADHTSIPQNSRSGDAWIKTSTPNSGADYTVKVFDDSTRAWATVDAPFYADDTAATTGIGASAAAGVLYTEYDIADSGVSTQRLKRWSGTAWAALTYTAGTSAPTATPVDGKLWYNAAFSVDIMVSTGSQWLGLNNHPQYTTADIILSASKPTAKPTDSPVDAGGALVTNDIWIDTSDTENFPLMYRYSTTTTAWTQIDNTDQTTPFGVVFADGRWHDGSTSQLQTKAAFAASNFVDPDAPDPLTYPNGTLLFNTRYSTNNVKEWQSLQLEDYTANGLLANGNTTGQYTVGTATFDPIADTDIGRWVTASGNRNDGAMWGGRKAQRQVIVTAMQSVVSSNEDIRNDTIFFNLIAAPGYVELVDEMVTLNVDKKQFAFIVGDTPARLAPDGTSIQNWATNANEAASNGEEGLTSADTYTGIYYPWGLSTNLDGSEVMVPPSHMALRTIAYNDQIAYQWFAPAGFNRGVVSNATTVGYLTSEEEFKVTVLNGGQRDTLYTNKINPISYMPGQGLVVFGQKTLHSTASALDRVNVVRLINHLRRQFNIISQPFLFEPNDKQTRDSVKVTFERVLGDLIGLRALSDFAVICDESNNTGTRIDRNELWVDIAIKPVKSIEFIFIPIRVLNTDDDIPR